jgi:hypothetical protein
MSKIIEENVAYGLSEFAGKLGAELQITTTDGKSYLQLTPDGAAELGRQLIRWAAEQGVQIYR